MKISKGKLEPNKPLKRVLIITYYWPPAGGSGVQRWLKFAKYLPENGWQPVIFCPDKADYTVYDKSLAKDIPPEAEIISAPIFEPYRFFRKITGQKEVIGIGLSSTGEGKSSSWLKKFMIWVRGNLFIPDARMFWIRPSVKRLLKYLESNPVDSMVSTGPPHSCHLIALGIKKKIPNLKWVADFRDPMVEIFYNQNLQMSKSTVNRLKDLENKILQQSDHVISVTPTLCNSFYNGASKEITLIPNGYDKDDFPPPFKRKKLSESHFTICYMGTFMPTQNVKVLWESIKKTAAIYPIELHTIGTVSKEVIQSIRKHSISNVHKHHGYLKHNLAIERMMGADLRLLIINDIPNGGLILTGKLFEYIGSGKSFIIIGPEKSDAKTLIKDIPHAKYFTYNDEEDLTKYLDQMINNHTTAAKQTTSKIGARFERSQQTTELVHILNQ